VDSIIHLSAAVSEEALDATDASAQSKHPRIVFRARSHSIIRQGHETETLAYARDSAVGTGCHMFIPSELLDDSGMVNERSFLAHREHTLS
jgi:hypothetical protein